MSTNFRMPELLSIGLGGGSEVSLDEAGAVARVGPRSVGCRLLAEAQCCGGDALVATDVALVAGLIKEAREGSGKNKFKRRKYITVALSNSWSR